MALRALAVAAALGLEVGAAVELGQVAPRVVAHEHHVAPAAAVPAVGPALGHVGLAAERNGAVAAGAAAHEDLCPVVKHAGALLALSYSLGVDRDEPAAMTGPELHDAGALGEDRVVLAEARALAGLEAGAALADDDLAAGDLLAGEDLHAEALGVGVAAVA